MSKDNYKLISTENIDEKNLNELLELSLNIKNNIKDLFRFKHIYEFFKKSIE